jgi:hypothetical protein
MIAVEPNDKVWTHVPSDSPDKNVDDDRTSMYRCGMLQTTNSIVIEMMIETGNVKVIEGGCPM